MTSHTPKEWLKYSRLSQIFEEWNDTKLELKDQLEKEFNIVSSSLLRKSLLKDNIPLAQFLLEMFDCDLFFYTYTSEDSEMCTNSLVKAITTLENPYVIDNMPVIVDEQSPSDIKKIAEMLRCIPTKSISFGTRESQDSPSIFDDTRELCDVRKEMVSNVLERSRDCLKSFSWWDSSEYVDEDVDGMCRLIEGCSRLESVYIASSRINDQHFSRLCLALFNNPKVDTIQITGEEMTHSSISELALLVRRDTVHDIRIWGDYEWTEELVDAVESTNKLQTLMINENHPEVWYGDKLNEEKYPLYAKALLLLGNGYTTKNGEVRLPVRERPVREVKDE